MKEVKQLACTIDLKSGFTHVLFNLFAQGYSHLKFEYSGGGDSGCIDSLLAYRLEDLAIDEETDMVENYNGKGVGLEDQLYKLMDEVVTDKILEKADDWWNNEGGGGTLWLDCRDGSYRGDHYINIITTEDSKLEGKLGDDASVRA